MFTLSSTPSLLTSSIYQKNQQNKSIRRKSTVVHVSASGLSPSKLKATGKRLLVIPDQEEAQTAGGILLMSSSASAGPGSSICGSVSSVGADCKTVKQGDSVLINGFAGSEIEFEDGSKGKFVTEDDVLAILG
ncbi:unnamed protein product [Bathycoccus prasinos]|jgi:chaperonin GroES